MLYYLNNCQNLKHAKIYGAGAIYDLWAKEFEDKIAGEISPGDMCLIASRESDEKITFTMHRFTGARNVPNPAGGKPEIWVLEGTFENEVVMPRSEAVDRAPYSRSFNKRGHFNQWSVVRGV
jgi:hypothetical protein